MRILAEEAVMSRQAVVRWGAVVCLLAGSAGAAEIQVLKEFARPLSGNQAGILRTSDGAIFGVASSGGTDGVGRGAIYRLEPDGSTFTVLHSLEDSDGYLVNGALLQGADGWLYGA